MEARNESTHGHDTTGLMYSLAWSGNVSEDPTWICDASTIITIESLSAAPSELRKQLQVAACACSGRVSGERIMERWLQATEGPVVRSPIEQRFVYAGTLLTRVGDAWYSHERLALLRAVAPAQYFRSTVMPTGSTSETAVGLMGYCGQRRLWIVLSCYDEGEPPAQRASQWEGRVA